MTQAELVLIVVTVLIGLFLIFALPADSSAADLLNPKWLDDWTGFDKTLLTGYSILTLEDFFQTQTVAHRADRWEEINPILGSHPEGWQVTLYFAAATTLTLTAANLVGDIKAEVFGIQIGPVLRKTILIGGILVEGYCVNRNAGNGVYFTFTLI